MICKKDVIVWFKELESYKRIDTMCTLLSMCLPFELRFLGTCLEELGRRDSQELRGIELRVNNPQDLATDMIACQKGEPTDMKIRRKMALYLALIRACNRTCNTSTEIFRTLDVWGDRDFESMTDMDTLQELLLVYTMAANHPVFTFEQHRRCIEVFERIKSNKLVSDSEPTTATTTPPQQPSTSQMHTSSSMPIMQMDTSSTSPLPTVSSSGMQLQHDLRQAMPPPPPPQLPPSHQEMHTLHTMHLSGQHPQLITCPAPIQVISQGSLPLNFPQHQIAVDALQHMNLSNIIPVDSNAILTHANPPWPPRPFPPPPQVSQQIEHPPQSSSPMLSQQSSPSSSRTTSPSRASSSNLMQQGMQQQQMRTVPPQRLAGSALKNVRRPSAETTPPPMAQMMNDISLPTPQNLKHVDDVVMTNDGSGNQLQTLIRNGYTRGAHHARLKAGNYIPSQQQQQQQQHSPLPQHYQPINTGNFNTTGIAFTMQNMTLSDGSSGTMHIMDSSSGMVGMNSNKSTGSDSGSSIGSSGEISPPETPTIMLNTTNTGGHRLNSNDQQPKHNHHQPIMFKQINIGRLNGGRNEKVGVSSTASAILYAPASTSQQGGAGQPQFGDIILAPGGNAGAGSASNMLQATSLGSNNNSLGDITSSNSSSSSNNNTISSSSSGAGLIGNVITSNAVILQQHQQQQQQQQQQSVATQQQPQYNATYPYHAAQRPPPPMLHNPTGGMAPPPPLSSTFRFPLPPNGELMYPPTAYHPASIAFLSSATAAGGGPPAPVTLRTTSTASVVGGGGGGGAATTQQQLQQLQQTQPVTALLAVSPYSTISTTVGTISAPKPLSCYNCGSQTHSGRDCQESSMDDVTRSAVYKLDYSVSAAASTSSVTNVATTSTSTAVAVTVAGGNIALDTLDTSTTSAASAGASLISTAAAAAVSNTK